MKIIGPRTFVELRVGAFQSVEVVIHIRRCDIPWFNGTRSRKVVDYDEVETTDNGMIFNQLLKIIQTSILTRMFADEIEKNHYTFTGQLPPPDLGPGGIPMQVPKSIAHDTTKKSYNPKRQRISKVKLAEMKRIEQEKARQQRQDEKDIYYATDSENTIQVAYRMEALPKYGHATLLFQHTTNLVALKKLQRRIFLWCYPINASVNHHSLDVASTYNHEMVPVATHT